MEYGDRATAESVRRLVASGRAPRPDRAVRALAEWAGDQGAVEMAGLLGADPSLNDSVFSRLREVRRRYPEAGRKELEAAFVRLFASSDRRIRRGALHASSDLGLPLEGLVALIDDREASVRCSAISAARGLSMGAAADAVESKLDDDDPDVRVSAAVALAALKPAARAWWNAPWGRGLRLGPAEDGRWPPREVRYPVPRVRQRGPPSPTAGPAPEVAGFALQRGRQPEAWVTPGGVGFTSSTTARSVEIPFDGWV
jgi:hypothetical protein